MFAVIRKIMTLLTSFIVIIVSLFSVGEFSPSVEMPALNAGELGQYVDPFTGTGGTPYMSGMTFPGAATPYGAVKLSPDTGIVGGIEENLDDLVADILCTSSVRAIRELEPKLIISMGNVDAMVADLKLTARTEKKLKVKNLDSLPAAKEVVVLS